MTNRLFVSIDFPPENGGIQNYVYGIVSHLDPKETVVLTSNKSGKEVYENFDQKQKFKTYRIGITNKVSFIKQMLQLIVLFFYIFFINKRHKINELHFGNVMPIGIVGPIAKKLFKVKFYPYIHGLDFLESKNNPLKFKLLMFSLRHATKIICNSNYTKNQLFNAGIDSETIKIIHPGIPEKNLAGLDKEAVIDKYKLRDKFVLLTVGRLVKRKGHDKMIESLKEIIQVHSNVKYVICGNGPEQKSLEDLVRDCNLEDYVVFTDNIERSELETIYAVADLFVMLNREIVENGDVEGYGIVFLEAGMYKLPVVGGNNGGVPDAVLNGNTGYLIDSTNVEEIVKTISSFLMDKNNSKKMGENGYRWVMGNCLWEHRVKLLDTL